MKKSSDAGSSSRLPPARPPRLSPLEIAEVLDGMETIMQKGYWTEGQFTEELECSFGRLVGMDSVAVGSGSAGLHCLYSYCKKETGGSVALVPANTFSATARAAELAGLDVKLYDVYPATMMGSARSLEGQLEAVGSRNVSAVAIVHIGGSLNPESQAIAECCEKVGVPVVEDAAHAHGARLYGKVAGGFGVGASYSLFPTKLISAGEGGVVASREESVVTHIRTARAHGRDGSAADKRSGFNWRISEPAALLAAVQCRVASRLRGRIDARLRMASVYANELAGSGVAVAAGFGEPNGYKVIVRPDGLSVAEFIAAWKDTGVTLSGPVFTENLERLGWEMAEGRATGAEEVSRTHVCLPVYSEYTEEELESLRCDASKVAGELDATTGGEHGVN